MNLQSFLVGSLRRLLVRGAEGSGKAPVVLEVRPAVSRTRSSRQGVSRREAALAALALLAAAGSTRPVWAETAISVENRRFMNDAAASGMAEIVLGRVAEEKAGSDAVRQFASHMVEDHNKANEELKAMAAAKGAALPTGLSIDQKAGIGRMKKAKGVGFDRAYMGRMLEDHRHSVALFERAAANSAGDAEVKAFATRNLPVLRSHLELAQQTNSGIATGAAAASNGRAARGGVKPVTRE